MDFPIFKTKGLDTESKSYDLNDVAGRWEYFHAKAGPQIERIKQFLETKTFVAFLLAKKGAGKGTYSKMLGELVGVDKICHLSIGDLVRDVHASLEDPQKKDELLAYMNQNYRGFLSLDEAFDAFLSRSTTKLVPTEFILALVKREIQQHANKAIFIDGFPRHLDQVSYSLYFRQIMNLRDDPDFFVLIDVPESVIDARIKTRLICPVCKTSRNFNLLPTKYVEYDKEKQEYFMKCDNPKCEGCQTAVMGAKEGDSLGIEPIRARLEMDGELIKHFSLLQGVPVAKLRNAIPVDQASEMVDQYEITPEYTFSYDESSEKVVTTEGPWVTKDDAGVDSYSLLAAPVVLSLIYQIDEILSGNGMR